MMPLLDATQRATVPRAPDTDAGRISRGAGIAIAVMLTFVVWQVAAVAVAHEVILPSPADVLSNFVRLAIAEGSQNLWYQLGVTGIRVAVGWSAAVLLGIICGAAMALWWPINSFLLFPIVAGRSIPPLAFLPFLIILAGIGEISKLALLFLGAFPVVATGASFAIARVDLSYGRAAYTLGATRLQALVRVVLPVALPEIMVSVRVGAGICWSAVIAAELIASTAGLGWMMIQSSRFLATSDVFVALLVTAAAALLTDYCLRRFEERFVYWGPKAEMMRHPPTNGR